MKRIILFISTLFFISFSHAQQIKILTNQAKISLRGLSVVNDSIIWASGSNGKVARSIDGGQNFEWITVKGYEQRDFRDIEAFDANTAVIMAVDLPAIILKTTDGGKTWKEVFHDDRKGMFLDAMDFTQDGNGIVVGDPIDGKLFIANTNNYGNDWLVKNPEKNFYKVDTGEALFAASGTNIISSWNRKYLLSLFVVTGGTKSRLFFDDSVYDLNIIQGKESTGANSIAINDNQHGVIVGGDFSHDSVSKNNCILFKFKGKNIKFSYPETLPHGYRSCVTFINDNKLITCGTSGIDISNDGGLNWKLISDESFHVCTKAKKGNAVFLAGKDGRIAKLVKE
jgi:hypothetical protein